MSRKDVMGVEVEVGDIVFSAARHKWSGKPEVGRVTRVSGTGRVTIQVPHKVSIHAYERGAPDVEHESFKYGPLTDENGKAITEEWTDWYGRKQTRVKQGRIPYTYKSKDYTVVATEWKWIRKQAADITLLVLRKKGEDKADLEKTLSERVGLNDLTRNLNLDYDAASPNLD